MDGFRAPAAGLLLGLALAGAAAGQAFYPASRARGVNPDVQLKITFSEPPTVGRSGQVRIRDAATGALVDVLDLAIPPGPTERATGPNAPYIAQPYDYARTRRPTNRDTRPGTPSAGADPTPDSYQLSIIGGFTDGFHFYPITLEGRTATIHPHHDRLDYGRTYVVEIDAGVLSAPGFRGLAVEGWRFMTKVRGPRPGATQLVVSADGKGDFDTVQGALDFVPDHARVRTTIDVRPGLYEELVYVRNKDNVTLKGAGPDRTILRYRNNEVFNPHPVNISTNEWPGTFPSRRAAFAADNVRDLHLIGMTFQTTAPGQAEGLLINGERNIVARSRIIGAGDALQVNGSAYVVDSVIEGTGDTILGRGPVFLERTTLRSTEVFMWIRNRDDRHGLVCKDCVFEGVGKDVEIARAPENRGRTYPFAEVVLLRPTLSRISPRGWGDADAGGRVRYWEFESRAPGGGAIDMSRRDPVSRRLDPVADARLIADYGNPAFVLDGWVPKLGAEEGR